MFDKTFKPTLDNANNAIDEVKTNANELIKECKTQIVKLGKLAFVEFIIVNIALLIVVGTKK